MVRAIRAVTVERGPRPARASRSSPSAAPARCMPATSRAPSASAACSSRPSPGVFTAMGMLAGAVEHHELRPLARPARRASTAARSPRARAEMRAAATAALVGAGLRRPRPSPSPRPSTCGSRGRTPPSPFRFDRFDAGGAAAGLPRRLSRGLRLYADRRGRGRRAAAARRGAHRRAARLPRAERRCRRQRPSPSRGGSSTSAEARPVPTPVVPREALTAPAAGPLIVEAPDTTIVIPPGARVAPHAAGGLVATWRPDMTDPDHLRGHQGRARHHRRRHGLRGDAHRALADRARRARLFGDPLRPRRGASSPRPRPWRCTSARCRTRWTWCWRSSPGDLFPGDVVVLNDPYAGGHAPARHLHDQADLRRRAAHRLRRGHRASLRHGRAGAGLERLGLDRDLPGGAAHPADEALRARACPTGRCSPSSRRTCACPDLVLGDLDAQYRHLRHRRARAPARSMPATGRSSRPTSTGCSTMARR